MKKHTIVISAVVAIVIAGVLIATLISTAKPQPSPTPTPTPTPTETPTPTPTPEVPATITEAPVLSIDPSTLQLPSSSIGQDIEINITIANVQNLWGYSIQNLHFNSSVLNLTKVQEGPLLKSAAQTLFLWSIEDTADLKQGIIGEIDNDILQFTGVNGSGVLATLTFQVISAGASPIGFGQTTLLDPVTIVTGVHQKIVGTTTVDGEVVVQAANAG